VGWGVCQGWGENVCVFVLGISWGGSVGGRECGQGDRCSSMGFSCLVVG